MTNYSRYSYHAHRALTHASLLVQRYRHPFVDTGHLLVGVMLTEGSIGCKIMLEMDLRAAQAEPHLQALYPILNLVGPEARAGEALEMTLELAASESAWLSHHYVGTEHLLLGITRTNAGNASALLRRLGTSPELLRSRVRRALNEGATELDLQMAKHMARLSELSRRAFNAAEQLAVTLDQPQVTIGHLLLVLAQETRSPTSQLLRDSGLDEARLRTGLASGDGVLMVRIERVLNQVLDLVEKVGSHYTGTEHLLLALLNDPAGSAALAAYGVRLDRLRGRLIPE
jgi:ATP-dependent Clp protease ATP-binding subunit ClpA